ncbi:uncharacterized protein LY79DRAFT_678781 [Colletotrichum navitas]|uniref:Uncharacterized protein n=1 Tax=Colletotrichum navitas TaxID=681940 RepID=A0AAD8Q5H0_9PEZI|nr:uncharacterized protein LY79DRAFT_678781 [Colletotrichum navitas]KAK1596250.1 hypothetical protein LY79DRAFT_678781 [Colletotrichum navitas]
MTVKCLLCSLPRVFLGSNRVAMFTACSALPDCRQHQFQLIWLGVPSKANSGGNLDVLVTFAVLTRSPLSPLLTRSTAKARHLRPWGSSSSDFQLTAIDERHKLNVTTEVVKKRKREVRPRPQLADSSDELHEFVKDLVMDEEFQAESTRPASEDGFLDAYDGEADHGQEDSTISSPNMKLERTDIDTLIDEVDRVCGPRPEMDLLPQNLVQRIEEHDRRYMSIFDDIFDMALTVSNENITGSPFSAAMLHWCQTNQQEDSECAT